MPHFESLEPRLLLSTINVPSGTIVNPAEVWTSDNVYVIDGTVSVGAGNSLTIQPGTVVKFESFSSIIQAFGTINADGTSGQPIHFTAVEDDTVGGDTNLDGGATSPFRGAWGSVRVQPGGSANFDHAMFRYGGSGMLQVNAGTLTATNSVFEESSSDGIRIDNANPTLTNNTYRNNSGDAISANLNSNPIISGVTISGNAINGIHLDNGTTQQSLNWTNPDITYYVDGYVTVDAAHTLTVGPGQVTKFASFSSGVTVNGTLDAQGTVGEPIYFTDHSDDMIGGDLNSDGDIAPFPGAWGRVNIQGDGSVLDHVTMRYGSSAMLAVNGATNTTISNSAFNSASGDGVRIDDSDPVFTNVSFHDNTSDAVAMDLNSNPTFSGVTMSGNVVNGVHADNGTTQQSLNWTNPDVTYYVDGYVTVDAAHTLTVGPGQVIKFASFSAGMTINGTLDAQGTLAEPIFFTDHSDDAVGGDLNSDADALMPFPGAWGVVEMFGDGSTLDHVTMRYGTSGMLRNFGATNTVISNSAFDLSSGDGVWIQDSDPVLTDVSFADNNSDAVFIDLNSNPTFSGVTMSGNVVNGVHAVNGTTEKSLNWTNPDVTYYVDGYVTVDAAHTLTVGPGQVVKFASFSSGLTINGALDAQGTLAAPIYFTDHSDDAVGGDLNSDADALAPFPGAWGVVELKGDGSTLDYVTMRYGSGGTLRILSAPNTTIRNSAFDLSSGDGVWIENSDPVLTDVSFTGNVSDAIFMYLDSNPVISGVTVSGNGVNGIHVDDGTTQRDLNWTNPDITYYVDGYVTVDPAHTLTVGPGQVVKFSAFSSGITVNGALDAQGTAAQPIYFTDHSDDDVGGDLNSDADAIVPLPGAWGRVNIFGDGSTLDHVTMRYGSNAMLAVNSATNTTVSNSAFNLASGDGVRIEDSDPVLSTVSFHDNSSAAVSMDLDADPTITNVTASGNVINGLQIDSGTIVGSRVWDDADIVHVIEGGVSVTEGETLTIGPGVIVKGTSFSAAINASGTLLVNGTAADPVYFTSFRDDSIGGDTNNDGDTLSPGPGNWGRINLFNTSVGSVIDHAHVSYGSDAMINVFTTATISNSVVRRSSGDGVEINGALADATLTNNVIINNGDDGVTAFSGGVINAINNTIDGNVRGINADGAGDVTLTNNSITFSTSRGVRVINSGVFTATFNNVHNPDGVDYEGVADATGSDGNISTDPKYFNRTNLNFGLRSGSPLLDTADGDAAPVLDHAGNARFDDPNVVNLGAGAVPFVDIGAFERQELSTSDIDLATIVVTGPTTGMQDEMVTVDWTVRNVGEGPALGSWHDAIYLSVDTVWTPDDVRIGELEHVGDLAPGASYDASTMVTLPGSLPGDYYLIVRANDRHEVFEALELLNNPLATSETLELDLPVLPFGANVPVMLDKGQTKLFRVPTPEGADLTISADGPNGAVNELFVIYEDLPTRQKFDARGVRPGEADQTVSIADTRAGDYVVMVRAADTSITETVTLTASLAGFGITQIGPTSGSNTGEVTITIHGAQFDVNSTPRLIDDLGATIDASAVYFIDSGLIAGTFDLTGAALGLADVEVVNTGNVVSTLPDAFNVVAGESGELSTRLVVPSRVRLGRSFTGYVEYSNIGGNDLPAPVLQLSAPGGLSSLGVTEAATSGETLLILGANDSGPAGILPPGASVQVPIFGRANVIGDGSIDLDLGQLTDEAIPWATLEPELRPDGMTQGEFAPLFAEIQAAAGATYEQYGEAIADALTRIAPPGGEAVSLDQVFQFIVGQAVADLSNSVDGRLFLNDTDDPLNGAELMLYEETSDTALLATSLADGTFTFPDVPDGTYELMVGGFGIPETMVNVSGADISVGDVVAGHLATVSGGVLLGSFGVPLVNTMVTAVSDSGDVFVSDTADRGRYAFEALPAGTYRIFAGGAPFTTQAVDEFVLMDGQQVRNLNFVLEQDATISGTLTGFAGALPAGGSVSIVGGDSEVIASVDPESDGDFFIDGLAAGSYDLRADIPGFARQVVEVTVSTNQSLANFDVAITEGGFLTGTLTDAITAGPLAGQLVELRDGDAVISTQITDAGGAYLFDHVPAGGYELFASIDDRGIATTPVTVNAGQVELANLTLTAAGEIEGQVQDSSALPVANTTVTAVASDGTRVSVTTDANGDYRINDLPFDDYDVVVGDADLGGLLPQSVMLTGGDPDATVNFVLPIAATISGTVFEADGVTPVEGIEVELFENDLHIMFARTDESGNYMFRLLKTGTFGIGVTDDGGDLIFPTGAATVSGGMPFADADFSAGGETVLGTITDQNGGGAIEGAAVTLLQELAANDFVIVAETTTDALGGYMFTGVADGDYRVLAEFDGLAFAETDLVIVGGGGGGQQPGNVEGVDLGLGASTSIGGRITDPMTGDPMPGVSVRVARDGESGFVKFGETDANGDYVVSDLPAGNYKATFAMDGHRRMVTDVISTSAGSTSVANGSLSSSNSSVEGRVIVGGQPVNSATIVAIDSFGQVAETTLSMPDGTFILDELEPGTFDIDVTSTGSDPLLGDTVDVFDNTSTADIELILERAATDDPNSVYNNIAKGIDWLRSLPVDGIEWVVDTYNDFLNPVERLPDHPTSVPAPSEGCEEHARLATIALESADTQFDLWKDAQRNYLPKFAAIEGTGNFLIFAKEVVLTLAPLAKALDGAYAVLKIGKKGLRSAEYLQALERAGKILDNAGLANDVVNLVNVSTDAFDSFRGGMLTEDAVIGHALNMFGIATNIASSLAEVTVELGKLAAENGDKISEIATVFGILGGILSSFMQAQASYNDTVAAMKDLAQAKETYENRLKEYTAAVARAKVQVAAVVACNKFIDDGNIGPPPPPPRFMPGNSIPQSNRTSFDPNDKTSGGFGEEGFIRDGAIPYLIQFENDPDLGATLPAQEVFITDTLDANLDLNTVEFTGFGFDNMEFEIPAGLSFYQDIIDLRPNGVDLLVSVTLEVDSDTRVLSATFSSIDPLTGLLPDDIDAGFLPVNDKMLMNGEGFFTFTIEPVAGLPTGTVITNQAEIVFDVNDPILTPVATNTIDNDAPASSVDMLPITQPEEFLVSWTGDDGAGSGPAGYDIYYKDDGGPLTMLAENTTETSMMFTGVEGHTYEFFSVARDNVGLTEEMSDTPDTSTFIQLVNLDPDGDGMVSALTDGILVVRFLASFGGDALTDGALGTGATRTDPDEIVAFLQGGLATMLDVDGNADASALSDGILIVRYLATFRGDALTDGAIAGGATRTDGAEIVGFLETYDPTADPGVIEEPPADPPALSEAPAESVADSVEEGSSPLTGSTVDLLKPKTARQAAPIGNALFAFSPVDEPVRGLAGGSSFVDVLELLSRRSKQSHFDSGSRGGAGDLSRPLLIEDGRVRIV